MTVTTAQHPTNRGQLLALIGALRNDDGTYRLKEPCPECGAEKLHILWDKSAGLDGTITHDGGGCVIDTAEFIEQNAPAPPPEAKPAKVVEVKPAAPVSKSADGYVINYIRFRNPVTCGRFGDLTSWSRGKHTGLVVVEAPPFLILSWDNERCRVSLTNVDYIADKQVS